MIWETVEKEQQLCFIKLPGCNANLGNIEHKEVIPLEAIRMGLRAMSLS